MTSEKTSMHIKTTPARAAAFARAMQHEHIPYGEEGQLWRAFLADVEQAMAETTTKPVTSTQTIKKPVTPRKKGK